MSQCNGKVIAIGEVKTGESQRGKWSSQQWVVEEQGQQYPEHWVLESSMGSCQGAAITRWLINLSGLLKGSPFFFCIYKWLLLHSKLCEMLFYS